MWAVELFGRWKTERLKERWGQKKSFEYTIENCRGSINPTCSHMTQCFNTLSLAAFLAALSLETNYKRKIVRVREEQKGGE